MASGLDPQAYLKSPVSFLPSIGATTAAKLEKLGIKSLNDLLHYYPFRHDDLSLKTNIHTLQAGETVTLSGQVTNLTNTYTRSGKTIQKGLFTDGTGELEVTWFNQPYLVKTLTQSPHISLSGKVKLFRGRLSLTAPQFEIVNNLLVQQLNANSHKLIHTGRLVPIYHETAGVSSKMLRRHISKLLQKYSYHP